MVDRSLNSGATIPLSPPIHSQGAETSAHLRYYQKLAQNRGLRFIDLTHQLPDSRHCTARDIEDYLQLQLIPWRQDKAGCMLIAALTPDSLQHSWAQQRYGAEGYRFVQTTPRDFQRCLSHIFPKRLSSRSIHHLAQSQPHLSARPLMRRYGALKGLVFLALLAGFLYTAPDGLLAASLIAVSLMHLATLGFKSILFCKGHHHRQRLWHRSPQMRSLADEALPRYSVLIPLYQEAAIVPQLIYAMRRLNYPREKLEIKLIVEGDDTATYNAILAERPDPHFKIVRVPPSQPRTKPKACNYALRFAQGDIITIYDAEDKPDPMQLRDVAQLFAYGPHDLVCVQCRLNYYDRLKNTLTRLFSIEYACWFDFLVPGLEAVQVPIPLGGTSNHLSRRKLMEMGEWDPFNVTEDADLGIRLASLKYRTYTLHSLTHEQAIDEVRPWIKQRSRWIKGYMQTWLVHMRRPVHLYKQLGLKGFLGFQLFIGGPPLVFLSTLPLLSLSAWWLIFLPQWDTPLSPLVMPLSLTALFYGLMLHWLFAATALHFRRWKAMTLAGVLFPFYWLLHSAASYRALWQLFTRPHYWDKTTHHR